MFGWFKSKTEEEKLYDKYEKLKKEAYELSTRDRMASDQKSAEADRVMKRIEKLKAA